ncbi:hypothetical protein GH146_04305 [archaeon]|nr:hypothetical protein [archaeon]
MPVVIVLLLSSARASGISSLMFSPLVGAFMGMAVPFDNGILSAFSPCITVWVSAVGVLSDVSDKMAWSPGWPLDVSGEVVLSPVWPLDVSGKTVLIPTRLANCPMAAMVDVEGLRKLKAQCHNAAVVSYVNTTADVKAESDICCTSANAAKVVNSLEEDEIIFVPDSNLAHYVMRHTDKKIIPWNGWCYVHNKFSPEGLIRAKAMHLAAKVLVHPECIPEVVDLADEVFSTTGMVNYVKQSPDKTFIIATEIGVIERLKLEFPEKVFFQAPPGGTC